MNSNTQNEIPYIEKDSIFLQINYHSANEAYFLKNHLINTFHYPSVQRQN